MKAVNDRIIVKPIEPEQVTAGGIHLPAQAQREDSIGTVVQVGPDIANDVSRIMGFDLGVTRVMYSRYGGTRISVKDEEYVVLRPTDILVILDDDE